MTEISNMAFLNISIVLSARWLNRQAYALLMVCALLRWDQQREQWLSSPSAGLK